MSDAAAPAKSPAKKASKPKVAPTHPQYKVMVAAAISALKERGGSSRQAILKYIMANYTVGDNPTAVNARVKTALKAGVKAGDLKQAKGTGAAGSFKLGEKKVAKKPKSPKKKAAKKPKSPKKAAAKPKKAAAKKPAKSPKKAAKKPAAKKAATPKKAAKSPAKKAAKPKAAKKPTAKKPAAKKPAAKKPATKKAPAKK